MSKYNEDWIAICGGKEIMHDAYIKKEMMKVKGGEFYNWYKNLPGYLQRAYKREFNKLQTKYER